VHAEATPHAHYTLDAIREAGCLAGLALNPGTPVTAVTGLVGTFEILLCMTVNPGWGGQAFIPGSEDRVRALRELAGPDAALEVDGGIDASTAGPCAEAGATLFVAGSSVFGASEPGAAYAEVVKAAGAG